MKDLVRSVIEAKPVCLNIDRRLNAPVTSVKVDSIMKRLEKPRDVSEPESVVELAGHGDKMELFVVALYLPDEAPFVTLMAHSIGVSWTIPEARIGFTPDFVREYIASIYGYRQVTSLQIAKEIGMLMELETDVSVLNIIGAVASPGGVSLVRKYAGQPDNAYVYFSFIPWEKFSGKEEAVKEVCAMAMSHFRDPSTRHGPMPLPADFCDSLPIQELEAELMKNSKYK